MTKKQYSHFMRSIKHCVVWHPEIVCVCYCRSVTFSGHLFVATCKWDQQMVVIKINVLLANVSSCLTLLLKLQKLLAMRVYCTCSNYNRISSEKKQNHKNRLCHKAHRGCVIQSVILWQTKWCNVPLPQRPV